MGAACHKCRHYQPSAGSTDAENQGGECRANPPKMSPDGAAYADRDCAPYGYWPVIRASDWCGSYKPKD